MIDWVGGQIAAQMACKKCRLNRRQRPPACSPAEKRMLKWGFLVLFPCRDQSSPPSVVQIDATARRMNEVTRPDLSAANQCDDETVRQRAQFLGKVKRERGPSCARAMEKSDLIVQADAFRRATVFGHQHA